LRAALGPPPPLTPQFLLAPLIPAWGTSPFSPIFSTPPFVSKVTDPLLVCFLLSFVMSFTSRFPPFRRDSLPFLQEVLLFTLVFPSRRLFSGPPAQGCSRNFAPQHTPQPILVPPLDPHPFPRIHRVFPQFILPSILLANPPPQLGHLFVHSGPLMPPLFPFLFQPNWRLLFFSRHFVPTLLLSAPRCFPSPLPLFQRVGEQ